MTKEPDALRDRYGRNAFGQSCLLARRLVEAGTRVVEVIWPKVANSDNHSWDHHVGLTERMKNRSGPMLDTGLSALIQDLDDRGLLDETLVVAVGEFGRSPQKGVSTSGNGNSADGRDHWPYCYTSVIAGAGVKRGYVHGKSDKTGFRPAGRPGASRPAVGLDLPRLRHRPADDRLQPPEPAPRAGQIRSGSAVVRVTSTADPAGQRSQQRTKHRGTEDTEKRMFIERQGTSWRPPNPANLRSFGLQVDTIGDP